MAEALAIVGSIGAISSLVAGIGKVILLITDLTAKWDDADLTLLSMASQLTALRAATTQIQEWTDRGLRDAHHQLRMDLDISVKCCLLLINKVEDFFAELSDFTEKPLDLRHKYKLVFGSAGPENVQKLIERQTSALTLLLTACNCNTLSEQQLHLETTKTRKVLKRAQADSVSLCVQRDAASFASKMTDNLSKISRVFEFDQNVFSTRVYERAFRGSVKQALRKQQALPLSNRQAGYDCVYLLGDREISKNVVINALDPSAAKSDTAHWTLYRSQMQRLCVELMCAIIKRGTPDWDAEHISVLIASSVGPAETRPSFSDVLDACAFLWWGSLRLQHEPDPDPQGYLREKFDFKDMVFHVDIIPAGGLNIYCGNTAARTFMDMMERVLPIRTAEPRYAVASTADCARAKAIVQSSRVFESRIEIGTTSISLTATTATDIKSWPTFENLQTALALAFVFDLQDYSNGTSGSLSDMQSRLESSLTELASLENRGAPTDLPFLLLLDGSETLKSQIKKLGFILQDQSSTHDFDTVVADVEARFRNVVKLPLPTLVLNIKEDKPPTELLNAFVTVESQRNGLPAIVEMETQT